MTKKNKYIHGVKDEKQNKNSISTYVPSNDEENDNIITDIYAEKAESEFRKKLDEGIKSNEKIEEYNNNLFENRSDKLNNIKLRDNWVMVRFLKIKRYDDNGLYIGGLKEKKMDNQKVKLEVTELNEDYQNQEVGVVVLTGPEVAKDINIGDKVHVMIDKFSINKSMRFIDCDNASVKFDNYWVFKDSQIDWIETN